MRTLGLDLPGLSPKTSERRPYPAGQHGQRRRKETEFGKRLHEKQKLRLNYGLSEKQMRNTFLEALNSRDNTGSKLIQLLERRLDNIVFRAGFARSIPAARQLVNHGHVLVNGKRVDIPSFRVKIGQQITLRDSSKQLQPVLLGLEVSERRSWENGWLNIDRDGRSAQMSALPEAEAAPFRVDVQLVVEYYALSA
jgi:small subunit ribosomal protein S4